jgi:hypothetical protein
MGKRRRKSAREQQDLFRPVLRTPLWKELPAETRRRATKLMARLLQTHRERARERAGGDDE